VFDSGLDFLLSCVLSSGWFEPLCSVSIQAILCGKVGQVPVQKNLRNGRMVTIFTVGTGGMFDQRIVGAKDLPKPAQWHRIAVHNDALGTYAVQQLVKKYISMLLRKLNSSHHLMFLSNTWSF
jgi:hypothetical protein